jgi:biotin synthase
MNEVSNNRLLIDKLEAEHKLDMQGWITLLGTYTEEDRVYAAEKARTVADKVYGKSIFIRGIVEFSNICKNNCYYCGIRAGNECLERYRLTEEEILECCRAGYEYGFRTFVLQSGEDLSYSTEDICHIVSEIKSEFPDCAVTLSIGEKSREEYAAYKEAGADRYLLRHETADEAHYEKLHPADMSWKNRMRCLRDLKELGYQTGCGIMVGSPYQTIQCIAEDMVFMGEFKPEMIGIGPFLPHKDTPFKDEPDGSVDRTLRLLAILRLIFPKVLLPATTALGTADVMGREKGILAGANVMMPNLSPVNVRKKYLLYDGKICTGEEAAECNACMRGRVERIGFHVVDSRGDHPDFIR